MGLKLRTEGMCDTAAVTYTAVDRKTNFPVVMTPLMAYALSRSQRHITVGAGAFLAAVPHKSCETQISPCCASQKCKVDRNKTPAKTAASH